LNDAGGARRGVEFGCTSITSNGMGDSMPFEELNWMMAEANDEVVFYDAFSKGFTVLTLKANQVEADFVKVSNIRSRDYFAATTARFIAGLDEAGGMGGLQRPMGGGSGNAG
jgi:alkaline phosphatase D